MFIKNEISFVTFYLPCYFYIFFWQLYHSVLLLDSCYMVGGKNTDGNLENHFEFNTMKNPCLSWMIYMFRLFVMLRRFPIESRGRQKKIYEVGPNVLLVLELQINTKYFTELELKAHWKVQPSNQSTKPMTNSYMTGRMCHRDLLYLFLGQMLCCKFLFHLQNSNT